MTPTELKTFRESLGLPQQWLADQARVPVETVENWETGGGEAPQSVLDMLKVLDQQLWQLVAGYMDQVKAVTAESGSMPEEIVLLRYHTDEDLWEFQPDFRPIPASVYDVLLARIGQGLQEIRISSVTAFMQPAAYRQWLGEREDSEILRGEWALQKP